MKTNHYRKSENTGARDGNILLNYTKGYVCQYNAQYETFKRLFQKIDLLAKQNGNFTIDKTDLAFK
jgi:hypothetical protein